jgi:RHS repeat-associated protein
MTRIANLKSDLTTISSYGYSYNAANKRTQIVANDGSVTTYAYDAANQLTYSLDSAGRTTYTFDADGNQMGVLSPAGARTTTLWDYENKTTLIQLPTGVRNTMSYDPDGLRTKLEDSAGTKKFLWDEQNYLAETDAANDTQAVYTNEPQVYGNLVSQRRSSATSWYHYDALGSTRQLSNASQAITDTYLYDAWGSLLAQTGTTLNPFRYVGQSGYYFDLDPATYYIRARIYQPTIARWWSVDPLEIAPIVGEYYYSLNSPILLRDASGLAVTGSNETSIDVGAELVIGGGTGWNLHIGKEIEPCCVNGAKLFATHYNIVLEWTVSLGLSIRLSGWFRFVDLGVKLLEFKRQVALQCNAPCGEQDVACCTACGSASFNFPTGQNPLFSSFQAVLGGFGLKGSTTNEVTAIACVSVGPRCPDGGGPGLALGICMDTLATSEASVSRGFVTNSTIVKSSGRRCLMLEGKEDFLIYRWRHLFVAS